jgi:hypothetical protein
MGFLMCYDHWDSLPVSPSLTSRDGDIYEYVAVYVDDLAFAMKDLQSFVNTLKEEHKFKLKGTGNIAYHLGCDFLREDDGTLCMAPRKYI